MPNDIVSAYKEQINQLLRRRDEAAMRLQAVSKTADEIRAMISGIDDLLLSLQEFVHRQELNSGDSAVQRVADSKPSKGAKRATGNSKKEEVANAAKLLIEKENRPLSRAELYSMLTAEGYQINGSNPEMVLSTMLWRAGRAAGVFRLKSGGYWLLERQEAPPQNGSEMTGAENDIFD